MPDQPQNGRPPLGVMPRVIWKEHRVIDLADAISRYLRVSNPGPGDLRLAQKWATELLTLMDSIVIDQERGRD